MFSGVYVCYEFTPLELFLENRHGSPVKSWSNWVGVEGLPYIAPLVVWHETRQLFLSSSESSESRQRLPKINRLSVQPQGWVRVTLHGAAHSLGLSLPTSKHSASLLHWLRTEYFYLNWNSALGTWPAAKFGWLIWCHRVLEITSNELHFLAFHGQLIDLGGKHFNLISV